MTCRTCQKPLPRFAKRYCSLECQRATWKKKCEWCGTAFIPSEQRVIFCSRSCGAAWKMSQPEIVKRMIAGKDLKAAGRKISRSILANKADRRRRSQTARRLKGNPFKGYESPGCGLIMTPAEKHFLKTFPEACYGLLIPTGKSSKKGDPHFYRIDFCWPALMLAVEIDGSYHQKPEQRDKDEQKDKFLKRLGWAVLRFSNKQVLTEMLAVKEAIADLTSR